MVVKTLKTLRKVKNQEIVKSSYPYDLTAFFRIPSLCKRLPFFSLQSVDSLR